MDCTAASRGQDCSRCRFSSSLRRTFRRLFDTFSIDCSASQRSSCLAQFGTSWPTDVSSCSAAFHGAELYVQLAPAVAPLLALLRDRASRSQCNAAGALGNLTRHADSVVPHLLHAGAVEVIPARLL
jgi:Armadillo/beta-catenin-like repeat